MKTAMTLSKRIRALMPTREQLLCNRVLARFEPLLHHPGLWHWSRRPLALGAALGIFFGLLVPFAQIPLAVMAAMLLRANVAMAAAGTFITNPLTFAPIYYAAYHLGSAVMVKLFPGAADGGLFALERAFEQPAWHHIADVWQPLQLGLTLSAVTCSLLVYASIHLLWRWRTVRRWRARAGR
jgi:uncharacterized protein (DUF2062 family)